MDDYNRKGKAPAETTSYDDQTHPASPHHSPSSSTPPSSSSSDPELVPCFTTPKNEEAQQTTTANQEAPSPLSSPRIQLSSIPRASSRPFFNPHPTSSTGSQRQPHPQESSQLSTVTTAVTATATSSTCSVFSHEQNLAAKLRLMKPAERADFRLAGHLGTKIKSRKKRKRDQSEAGRTRITRIPLGSSPLGSDLTPYQKVQKCLAQLKGFINSIASPDTSLESPQPSSPSPDPSTTAHATSSSSSGPMASSSKCVSVSAQQASCSSSFGGATDGDQWTVEEVIGILEQFLTRIPITIGAQEMENGLWEIQTRLGVDPKPTWYALMCKSHDDMWESLTDYFDCVALDKASLEDVVEKDISGSGASGAGPSDT